ncbi:MAG: DUF2721 domain-containing protein [Microcystaceae cyanobacterium]
MDTIALTTPALLFPAISLLLLAYTNRFLVIAQLIRELHQQHMQTYSEITRRQIFNLRKRVKLIKWMQIFGVLGFFLCTISMLSLFLNKKDLGAIAFAISLGSMGISLLLSLYEVSISINALNIALSDMEKERQTFKSNLK